MEYLIIYNDNISLFELFLKIDKGTMILDNYKDNSIIYELTPTIIESVLLGLYNPVIWLLEDSVANRLVLIRNSFLLTLYKFYKDEVYNEQCELFSELKPKLQNKFEDSLIVTRTISYHPNLDIPKTIQLLECAL